MTEERTETEQLIDDLTGNNPEELSEKSDDPVEQPEEVVVEVETEEDEILSEEELEVEREIESYVKKSEELDAKLAEFKAVKVDEVKRETLRNLQYSEDQIERYSRYIDGETAEEIKQSAFKLMSDVPPKDSFGDPSPLNGTKQRPTGNSQSKFEEIGKRAYERVKHKLFPTMFGGGRR